MKQVVVELRGRSVGDALAQALQRVPGRGTAVEVLLSGALARPFMFGPVAGLKGWKEVQAAARAVAPALCGVDDACVLQLESDPTSGPALATAVGRATLDAVYEAAEGLGVKVKSIRPVWAWALDGQPVVAGERQELLPGLVVDADASVLVASSARTWRQAVSRVSATNTDDDLLGWLRRVQLEHNLDWQAVQLGRVEATVALSTDIPVVRWTTLSLAEVV
jgi:hypothetical protein